MEFEEALALVNQAFNAKYGRYINDLEYNFFKEVWEGLTYEEIAERLGYTLGTIARNVAPKFWKSLSEQLGEGVGKTNFKEPLKHYRDRQNNNLSRSMPEPLTPLEPQSQKNTFNENNEFEAFKIIIDTIKTQKNKEIDVITISANNYDFFIKVDKTSPEHESVILDESFACAGGSGANTVCGLSRLGKKTAIVGCVKKDFEGEELFKSFKDFSVDTEFLISDNTNERNIKTGSTTILVEKISARRQILVAPGIKNYLSEILKANNEQLLEALVVKLKKSKILHLSSFAGKAEMELQLTVLNYIKNKNTNIIVSLTPGAIYVEEGLDGLNKLLACTNRRCIIKR